MVEATKNSNVRGTGSLTAEDLIKIARDSLGNKKLDKVTSLQIESAAKKISSSLRDYMNGTADMKSTLKGLDGLNDLAIVTGKNEKEIGELVSRYKSYVKMNKESGESGSFAEGKRRKQSRLKRALATSALGLTLLGTPVRSLAQRPATHPYSQSYNARTNQANVQQKKQKHLSEIEEYESIQKEYYSQYQKRVEQNIKHISGMDLQQARTNSIVSIDFDNMRKLQTIQNGQMYKFLNDIVRKQRDPQMATLLNRQNIKIEKYMAVQQNYYNKHQLQMEQHIKYILSTKSSLTKKNSIISTDFEYLSGLQDIQKGQMNKLLDTFEAQRKNLAEQEAAVAQRKSNAGIQQEELRQNAIREQRKQQEKAIKMMRRQQEMNMGMRILQEGIWAAHAL